LHQHSKAGRNCPKKEAFEYFKRLLMRDYLKTATPITVAAFFDYSKNFTESK
jgi:hypothetical protein